MINIIFETENGAENVINMHNKSELKEPPDEFEIVLHNNMIGKTDTVLGRFYCVTNNRG